MAKTRKTLGRRAKTAPPPKKEARLQLAEPERDLIRRLSERTGLEPRVVLERALTAYAAAAAPGMPLHAQPLSKARRGAKDQKLFLSVDGKPEIEIDKAEFILGSGPEVDLRLDLPLISPRHARILWKGGRPVFEDLRSARGSYRLGQPVDVRAIETGDEIDLGGFLPIRFRLAEGGV
ncbi:MAG TPA: FHA domain-containing protein [Myxococcales bacterium]|nr:FHA domain-containing protein [Myxococcales bacterium]